MLEKIAERYDINLDDLRNFCDFMLNTPRVLSQCKDTEDTAPPDIKCFAFVRNKNGICRCNRNQTNGNFCKTHFKMHKEGTLTHGYHTEKHEMKELQKIKVGGTKYFYDKVLNKVYKHKTDDDMSSLVEVGVLGLDGKKLCII